MNITGLDEWQGVTPQLVADWLLANGWTQTKPRWWERGEDAFIFDSETFDQLWFWTHALAAIYTNGNVQALLREFNPRMRKGRPSEAARIAHGGPWIGHMGGEFPLVSIGYWNADGSFHAGLMSWDKDRVEDAALLEHPCAFWPGDANGNKTRWPTDAEGKML